MPQIEVTFDIDANGILNVSAKDMATASSSRSPSRPRPGLSKEEVERMVKEAEAHAAEDARRREEIELRNQTDSLVYSTERALAEHGAKLCRPTERDQSSRPSARPARRLKGDDVERIRRAQEGLTRASQTLAEAMYGRQSAPAAAGGSRG